MIRWKNSLVRLVCAGLCLFSLLVCTSILVPDRGGQTHPIGDEGFLTAAAVCVPLFWSTIGRYRAKKPGL